MLAIGPSFEIIKVCYPKSINHTAQLYMSNQDSEPDMKLFWGCFIALLTTAFAFITRVFLVNALSILAHFWIGPVQAQELFEQESAFRDQYHRFQSDYR